MRKLNSFIASVLLVTAGCAEAPSEPDHILAQESDSVVAADVVKIISEKMKSQQEAWNSGSLEDFMIGYWESDSLVFIGKSGLTYGWDRTLENYKKSYPTSDSMGVLQFKNISIDRLDVNSALVLGEWTLFRDQVGDTLKGHYSLNWVNKNGNWVIVADHSS